jgi:hypothetical protein
MLKQKSLFIGTLGIVFSILTGCSQSDGYSTSKNEAVEVIHGYTLPTEPDPTINNSTLLGIDSNDNGVRDDVEIWILNQPERVKKFSKILREQKNFMIM